MFYGDTMAQNEVVYSGMNARLMFRSLKQRFECPLSTTSSKQIATEFANNGGDGVVLVLRRANPKTKYLDVARFSAFKREKERLFMGSTLKIVDIKLGSKSL